MFCTGLQPGELTGLRVRMIKKLCDRAPSMGSQLAPRRAESDGNAFCESRIRQESVPIYELQQRQQKHQQLPGAERRNACRFGEVSSEAKERFTFIAHRQTHQFF